MQSSQDMTATNTALKHIAIVMDGNGRWAQKRSLPRAAGHAKGVSTLKKIVQHCCQLNTEVLTIFAFSSENWQRPRDEVNALLGLFISSLKEEIDQLHQNQIRINFIGDIDKFNADLKRQMESAQQLTAANTGLVLNVALSYGGRWDVLHACRKMCAQLMQGDITLQDIDESLLSQSLSTHPMPEPDLFIRTAGEQRISNFLIWQLAYTELYFTSVLWPDFEVDDLNKAIEQYSRRKRKFGLTQEQVNAEKA